MNTTEKNILIAEFLGAIEISVDMYFLEETKKYVEKNNLQFHSSWEWLMQVVEKIESIDFEVSIRGNSVTVVNNSGKTPYFQPHSVKETKIKSIYEAVIKFILWFNENKK